MAADARARTAYELIQLTHAFVDAMHPTLILPIVVLVPAAVAAVFVRGHKAAEVTIDEEEAAVA